MARELKQVLPDGMEFPQKCSHAAPGSDHFVQRSRPYKATRASLLEGCTTSYQKNFVRFFCECVSAPLIPDKGKYYYGYNQSL